MMRPGLFCILILNHHGEDDVEAGDYDDEDDDDDIGDGDDDDEEEEEIVENEILAKNILENINHFGKRNLFTI